MLLLQTMTDAVVHDVVKSTLGDEQFMLGVVIVALALFLLMGWQLFRPISKKDIQEGGQKFADDWVKKNYKP